jgi:hypothetical protein
MEDLVEQFSQLLFARDLAPFVRFDSCGYAESPPRRSSSEDTLETAPNPNTTHDGGCSVDFDVGQPRGVDSLTSLILQTLDIKTAPFYRVVQAEDAEPVVSLEPARSLFGRESIASAQTAPWVVD